MLNWWSHRESNPDLNIANVLSYRWTMTPIIPRLDMPSKEQGFKVDNFPQNWCYQRESNPHGLLHWVLSPARLPNSATVAWLPISIDKITKVVKDFKLVPRRSILTAFISYFGWDYPIVHWSSEIIATLRVAFLVIHRYHAGAYAT